MDRWGKRLLVVIIVLLLIILIFNKYLLQLWYVFRYFLSILSIIMGTVLIGFYHKGLDWDRVKFGLRYYLNYYILKRQIRKIEFEFDNKGTGRKQSSIMVVGVVLLVSGIFTLLR